MQLWWWWWQGCRCTSRRRCGHRHSGRCRKKWVVVVVVIIVIAIVVVIVRWRRYTHLRQRRRRLSSWRYRDGRIGIGRRRNRIKIAQARFVRYRVVVVVDNLSFLLIIVRCCCCCVAFISLSLDIVKGMIESRGSCNIDFAAFRDVKLIEIVSMRDMKQIGVLDFEDFVNGMIVKQALHIFDLGATQWTLIVVRVPNELLHALVMVHVRTARDTTILLAAHSDVLQTNHAPHLWLSSHQHQICVQIVYTATVDFFVNIQHKIETLRIQQRPMFAASATVVTHIVKHINHVFETDAIVAFDGQISALHFRPSVEQHECAILKRVKKIFIGIGCFRDRYHHHWQLDTHRQQ
mmetsp:Transcript_55784/g.92853  ORF Transcript_55784/g.92853 Transcript_55784/m.92853 type:complete len:349 (-) Transcript_55784:403-1449(-)